VKLDLLLFINLEKCTFCIDRVTFLGDVCIYSGMLD
jgi:hypothetical protein